MSTYKRLEPRPGGSPTSSPLAWLGRVHITLSGPSLLVLSSILLFAGAAIQVIVSKASAANSSPSPGEAVPHWPVTVATWFPTAVTLTQQLLSEGFTALDAVELGCSLCEDQQCDGTVGWGGSPDTGGETTLDAMIMCAETHSVGAVTALRRVKHAISAARKVMTYTQHTLLAGDGATNWSLQMGLPEEDLHSQKSVWEQGNW